MKNAHGPVLPIRVENLLMPGVVNDEAQLGSDEGQEHTVRNLDPTRAKYEKSADSDGQQAQVEQDFEEVGAEILVDHSAIDDQPS